MMIKDYILTDHAKQRMEERNISINDLKDVLECPDISYKGIRGEMNVVKKIGKDKKIRVVYVLKGKEKIIITAIAEAMMGRKEEE
jgi:hypothetical protein